MLATNSDRAPGNLTVGIPAAEGFRWHQDSWSSDRLSVCTVETNEAGDLIVGELLKGSASENPVFFCLAYFDERHRNELATLIDAPELRHFFHNTRLVHIGGAKGIAAALLAALADYLAPLAGYASEQALALSAVRREYERVHLRFSALEGYVQLSAGQVARERLLVPPDRYRSGEAVFADVGSSVLRQLLPVSSKGLCAIDLLIGFGRADTTSKLNAALLVGDEPEPVAEWLVAPLPAAGPAPRWYSLGLDRSLDGLPRTARLELKVEEPDGSRIRVATAAVIGNTAYCIEDASEEAVVNDRPLAMRLWEAPPGLLMPRPGNVVFKEPHRAGSVGGRLPGVSLQHVRELKNARWRPDFLPVSYIAGDEAIGVHPPDEGASGAILDAVVPRGALSVSATAFIAHDASNPIEFALAVVEPPWTLPSATKSADAPEDVVAWSGWRSVAPQERHQLTVLLGPAIDVAQDRASLIMMTRMQNGAPNSFAWARFADVTIEAAA